MRAMPPPVYWMVALALITFGLLAMFSFGVPFFVLGLALVAFGPFRNRPAVFWPAIGSVIAFFVGYVLVAPLGCTTTAVPERPEDAAVGASGGTMPTTVCTNVLGIDYSGSGNYQPPLRPALITGFFLAAVGAVGVRALVHRTSDPGGQQAG